jgi:hypothetical protein
MDYQAHAHENRKELADMTTKTSTATKPGQDMTGEERINMMRELFARAGRAAAAWGGGSDG